MPFLERLGGNLFYDDTGGDGEVLFFTHGFASSSATWDGQMALGSRYRLIRWDMRGHGRSDSPDDASSYSKQHQVEDMAAVLDACGVQQAVFVGHSMGAFDSLLFLLTSAEGSRRVKALVLIGAGPGFAKAEARQRWNQTAEKLAKGYAAKGFEALVGSDRSKGHSERGAKVGLAHAAKNVFGHRDDDPLFVRCPEGPAVVVRRLPTVSVPVLLAIGERDKQYRAGSEAILAKVPNARLVTVPGAGHMAHESQPEAFNELVVEFVESLSAVRSRL